MSKKIAVVFPGQGSQYVGMGKELYQNYETVKNVFDTASNICGFDIASLCFNGPIERLTDTEVCQVCLFTLNYSCWQLFQNEFGVIPVCTSGHSLGEYNAFACAGAFSFEDGLSLVRKRAKYMKEATVKNPGTMVAVLGKTYQDVEVAIAGYDGLYIANINAPEQIVVAGYREAVQMFLQKAEQEKIKCIPLNVSGAFHTPLMDSAYSLLSREIENTVIFDCKFPVYANCNGNGVLKKEDVKSVLKQQIISSVQWVKIIQEISTAVDLIIELGPKKVLSGLIKKISPDMPVSNIEDVPSLKKTVEIMKL